MVVFGAISRPDSYRDAIFYIYRPWFKPWAINIKGFPLPSVPKLRNRVWGIVEVLGIKIGVYSYS